MPTQVAAPRWRIATTLANYYRVMQRILIRRGNALYRLIAFEFRDHADGSFYIEYKTAEREGKHANREKIFNHATGRIKFSGPLDHVIFGDPIFALARMIAALCCCRDPSITGGPRHFGSRDDPDVALTMRSNRTRCAPGIVDYAVIWVRSSAWLVQGAADRSTRGPR